MDINSKYYITSTICTPGLGTSLYEFIEGTVDRLNVNSVRIRYTACDGTTRKMTFSMDERLDGDPLVSGAARLNSPDKQIAWHGFSSLESADDWLMANWDSSSSAATWRQRMEKIREIESSDLGL